MMTAMLINLVLLLACRAHEARLLQQHGNNNRQLWRNKLNTKHLIRLEFSGVTYASVSLDVVKADLADVVEDVLTTHYSDGIEVLDVERTGNYRRKLPRHIGNYDAPSSSSRRRLSFIVLAVHISLRHDSWISTLSTLDQTIDILSEYVDKDFRQYMKNLPGNGDYVGKVEVLEAYTDISINVSGTQSIPISSPTSNYQQPTTNSQMQNDNYMATGSFPFELSFNGVSYQHANSQILRSYIQYGVERILMDNLDPAVQLVSVSMEPWLPRIWLNFPMTITLHYPTSWNGRLRRLSSNAFEHAYTVLGNNVDDLDLYLDNYVRDESPSYNERTQLESEMRDVFGEVATIEIEKETPSPTPIKVVTPVVNDWVNTKSDSEPFTMPWWGWVIVGGGIVMVCMCCLLCVIYSMRGTHTVRKKETVVTNVIRMEDDPATKATKYHYRTNNEQTVATKEYNNIDENKRSITKNKLNAEEYNLVVLQEPQYQVVAPVQQPQLLIHDPNPGMDLIVYEPNPNAPDPEEDRIAKSKPKKEKKKKKHGEKKKKKKHREP